MICFVSDIWYHFVLFYLKLYCTHIDTCCTMHKSFKKVNKIWNYFLNRYSLFMLSVSVGTGDICYIRNLWIRNEIFSFLMQFIYLDVVPEHVLYISIWEMRLSLGLSEGICRSVRMKPWSDSYPVSAINSHRMGCVNIFLKETTCIPISKESLLLTYLCNLHKL